MTRDVEEDPTPCAFNSWARMAALTDYYCLGSPDDDDDDGEGGARDDVD